MKKWFAVVASTWLLFVPQDLWAEEPGEVEELEEVVVTATRLEEPLKEVASSVTVISREEVEEKQQATISEAIRSVPGLDVVQGGGPGMMAQVFIRGAGDGQTLVMMDGIELNDPVSFNRSYDFAYLTTDNIERIEVVRGPQSTLYGSDAAGGVINIITRKGEGPFKATLAGEAGTYQTYLTRANLSGGTQQFHYSLGGTYVNSDGISAAKEKGYTLSGERYRNPEKDGHRNSTLSGRVGWTPTPTLDCELILRYLDGRSDLDNHGGQGGDDPNAGQDVEQFFSRLQGRLSLFGGFWEQKLGVSLSNQDRDYRNDEDADHPTESEKASYDGRVTKLDWQHNLYLHPANTLTLGLEYEVEKGRSDYSSQAFGFSFTSSLEEKKATTRSAYLQDEVRLKDLFFLTAGIRLDDHGQFGSQTTWRLAPAILVQKTKTKIKGSWGTGFKAPTLYQLYDPQYGDKDLDPEKSKGWDVGVEQDLFGQILSLGATYFYNHFKDLIEFDAGINRFANVAKVETKGVECFAAVRPIPDLAIRGTFTRTDAEDEKTGLTLVRRPRNKWSLEMSYRFWKGANLNLVYRYVGERFDYDYSTFPATRVKLSQYALVNLAASYDVTPHFQIFGRVENLVNEDYEEVLGYGTPGRSVFGGLKLSF
jgi:vitamin B12 transporter